MEKMLCISIILLSTVTLLSMDHKQRAFHGLSTQEYLQRIDVLLELINKDGLTIERQYALLAYAEELYDEALTDMHKREHQRNFRPTLNGIQTVRVADLQYVQINAKRKRANDEVGN